jgi:hypothetical protein
MPSTPREIVQRSLRFEYPERVPRDLWLLPWAVDRFPETVDYLRTRFPSDFDRPAGVYQTSTIANGNPYDVGTYIDEWGCVFENVQKGVVGEVRTPILPNIAEWKTLNPPYDILPSDPVKARDSVNRFCASSDKFVLADCGPRPWERYQFLRGTMDAMMDVGRPTPDVHQLLKQVHDFYLTELEFWVSTDVNAIAFADDWGAQEQLLISPESWREMFKPLYRDYCDLAHAQNKFAMMHSDGFIRPILEDLIEVGVDALNAQVFCMDMAELGQSIKGRMTFWGEIDRQHVLPSPDPQVGRDAVRTVARHLWDPSGGIIAQFEFGPGANPDTAISIFEEWEAIQREHRPPMNN